MNGINPPPLTPTSKKTSALAICSLVFGVLSYACLSVFASIPAVICGHLGLSRINRSEGTLEGRGLAIAGLILGYINIAMLPLLMIIAVPNFLKARETALRTACHHNLQLIENAKQQWAVENKKKTIDAPSESDLASYLPNGMPHCPAGGTYTIHSLAEEPTCSIPGHHAN